MAVQEGPTSIRVIWGTSQDPKKVIGFRVYYQGATDGSVDIDDVSINQYLLNGLRNSATYTISIVGKSKHLPSSRIEAAPVDLGEFKSPYLLTCFHPCFYDVMCLLHVPLSSSTTSVYHSFLFHLPSPLTFQCLVAQSCSSIQPPQTQCHSHGQRPLDQW